MYYRVVSTILGEQLRPKYVCQQFNDYFAQ